MNPLLYEEYAQLIETRGAHDGVYSTCRLIVDERLDFHHTIHHTTTITTITTTTTTTITTSYLHRFGQV